MGTSFQILTLCFGLWSGGPNNRRHIFRQTKFIACQAQQNLLHVSMAQQEAIDKVTMSQFWANAPCTQHFSTYTQHNFENFTNTLYSGNKTSEVKIMHSGKINPEEIFVFRI